jgi:hypothetical protein
LVGTPAAAASANTAGVAAGTNAAETAAIEALIQRIDGALGSDGHLI